VRRFSRDASTYARTTHGVLLADTNSLAQSAEEESFKTSGFATTTPIVARILPLATAALTVNGGGVENGVPKRRARGKERVDSCRR